MHKILKLIRIAERLLTEIERETGLNGDISVWFHAYANSTNREKALQIGNAIAAIMDTPVREWQADEAAGVSINERGKVEVTVFYRLENKSLTIPDQREKEAVNCEIA